MIDLVCTFFVVSSGKPSASVEAHLVAEHGQRAGARAIVLGVAVVADVAHEVEVLAHRGERKREREGRRSARGCAAMHDAAL